MLRLNFVMSCLKLTFTFILLLNVLITKCRELESDHSATNSRTVDAFATLSGGNTSESLPDLKHASDPDTNEKESENVEFDVGTDIYLQGLNVTGVFDWYRCYLNRSCSWWDCYLQGHCNSPNGTTPGPNMTEVFDWDEWYRCYLNGSCSWWDCYVEGNCNSPNATTSGTNMTDVFDWEEWNRCYLNGSCSWWDCYLEGNCNSPNGTTPGPNMTEVFDWEKWYICYLNGSCSWWDCYLEGNCNSPNETNGTNSGLNVTRPFYLDEWCYLNDSCSWEDCSSERHCHYSNGTDAVLPGLEVYQCYIKASCSSEKGCIVYGNCVTPLDCVNDTSCDYTHCIFIDICEKPFSMTEVHIICILITVIGWVGNLFSIIIFTKPLYRQSSTAYYLVALGVIDNIQLFFVSLNSWSNILFNVDMVDQLNSDVWCKINTFIRYSIPQMSSWILVMVTIERTVSVFIPLKVKLLCSLWVAKIVLFVLLFVISGVNSVYIILYESVQYYIDTNSAIFVCEVNTFTSVISSYKKSVVKHVAIILPWVDFCSLFALPFFLIGIGNVMIIVKLAMRYKVRKLTSVQPYRGVSLTVTLVAVNFVFLLTVSPQPLSHVANMSGSLINEPSSLYTLEIVYVVSYLNPVCNFYLYCLSGSKFRAEVKKLLCNCKKATN